MSRRRATAEASGRGPRAGRLLLLVSGLALISVSGCSLLGLDQHLSIRTDETEYFLGEGEDADVAMVTVRITNHSGQTVYLHRQCGYGDHPARHLVPVFGGGITIEGRERICITLPPVDPIEVAEGDTYEDRFQIVRAMTAAGGVFRVAYDVQLENRSGDWGPTEPVVPRDETASNTFDVRLP